ncbi:unnamed protein product [Alopecurus aequalis]
MAHNFAACKKALCRMKEHGHTDIIVSKTIPEQLKEPNAREQDGLQVADMVLLPKLRLYEGVHRMGPTEVKCLILKLDTFDEHKYNSFNLLKNFRNPAVVTLQAFCEDACLPRIALSWVDCRLDDLVRSNEGPKKLFEDQKNGQGCNFSALCRSFFINICSGLDSLFKEGLYPRHIKMDDLYLCHVGSPAECVKLLVLSADKIKCQDSTDRREQLWKEVRDLAEQIKRITDNTTARQISRRSKNKIKIDEVKGEYLMSIISADEEQICLRLKRHGVLKWPVDASTKKTPDLLQQLISNDEKRSKPYGYKTKIPYHYLLLCRTAYKHFDSLRNKVSALKDQCQKPRDFLERMERWNPEIWCILYDAIGLPDEP